MSTNIEIEFVIDNGENNFNTSIQMGKKEYQNFQADLSIKKTKRKRGRPSKKHTIPTPIPNKVSIKMVEKQVSSGEDSKDWDDQDRKEVRGTNYNYKIRKEFLNENFDDNKQIHQDEHSQDLDDEDDNMVDDDDFINRLEQNKEKGKEVDLSKLTNRQRTAHFQKQNISQRGQFAQFQQYDANGNLIEGNMMEIDDYSEGLPHKPKRNINKIQISQAQSDENKRRELTKILEEQQAKMKEKFDRLKGNDIAHMPGGVLSRYMQHNTKQHLQKPGMEQFAISIKMKYYRDEKGESKQLCFPKGIQLPECFRNENAYENLQRKMEEKKIENVCYTCKQECDSTSKKYKCKNNGRVTCSFDCYKQANSK